MHQLTSELAITQALARPTQVSRKRLTDVDQILA